MKKILSMFGAIALVLLAVAGPVYALVKADDTIIVKADEVVDDDMFVAGEEVVIEGIVNGDVYVLASQLSVRGTVNGDVLGLAETIDVSGEITEDLRVAGNSITLIGATIGDSVTVGSNTLSIDGDSTIGGGLIFGGRSLALDGSVGRGIMTGSQTTRVDGPVGSTMRVAAESITIGEDAVIEGNLEYNSEQEAVIEGEVVGEVIQNEGLDLSTEGVMRWLVVAFNVWAFLAALIIGGVLMLLFPGMFRRADTNFRKKPWPAVGWGTLVLLATMPAAFVLLFTVVGIPLALLLVLLWILAILFAKYFVGFTVGNALLKYLKKSDKDYAPQAYWALVIGLVLYYLLRMVPYVGIFVRLATTVVGIGIMLTLYKRPKTKKT